MSGSTRNGLVETLRSDPDGPGMVSVLPVAHECGLHGENPPATRNAASVFGVNAEGLKRAGVSSDVKSRLHHAFKILFHSKLSMRHALKQVAGTADHCAELQHLLAFIRQSTRGIARA